MVDIMPMMNFQTGHPQIEHVGLTSASTTLTSFTCNANDSKGSWTQVTSSLSKNAEGFLLNLRSGTNTLGPFLIDIGIGSAGNEVAVVENILLTTRATTGVDRLCQVWVPLHLTAGQRISVRGQTGDTSNRAALASFMFIYSDDPTMAFGRCQTVGVDTGTSLGTTVALSNNSKGSWVQLSSSTGLSAKAIMLAFGNSADVNQGSIFVDVGVGAASSEIVVIPDIYNAVRHSSVDVYSQGLMCYPCNIPIGSRLAVRGQYEGDAAHASYLSMAAYLFG